MHGLKVAKRPRGYSIIKRAEKQLLNECICNLAIIILLSKWAIIPYVRCGKEQGYILGYRMPLHSKQKEIKFKNGIGNKRLYLNQEFMTTLQY